MSHAQHESSYNSPKKNPILTVCLFIRILVMCTMPQMVLEVPNVVVLVEVIKIKIIRKDK